MYSIVSFKKKKKMELKSLKSLSLYLFDNDYLFLLFFLITYPVLFI